MKMLRLVLFSFLIFVLPGNAEEMAAAAVAATSSIAAPDFVAYGMSVLPPDWQRIITAFLMFVGAARLAFKPITIAAHKFVASTATAEDDAVLARIEASRFWRVALFVLDYFASVKLPASAGAGAARDSFKVELQTRERVSPGPTDHPGATAAAMFTMAAGLAALLGIAVLATGCASNSQRQYDRSFGADGKLQREIETRVSARTVFDAKSELANFKASQTDKTQSIAIGRNAAEASSTNASSTLKDLIRLYLALQGVPVPAP